MTKTFYFCPNCLKTWTVTGTMPKPDWMVFMINDHQSFHRKKATTHEIPFSRLMDEEYLLVKDVIELDE